MPMDKNLVALRQGMEKVITGQDHLIEQLIIAVITGSHVLLEGLPGVAKTRAVTEMSHLLFGYDEATKKVLDVPQGGNAFIPAIRRIQFMPDLQPSDLIGGIRARPAANGRADALLLESVDGPIRTYILLADEINRAPSKVQAALLEVMQERKISRIDGTTVDVNKHRILSVFATQNPREQEGTYPLSEAALDRFLFKILVEVPQEEVLLKIIDLWMDGIAEEGKVGLFAKVDELKALIDTVKRTSIPPYLRSYIARIVSAFGKRPEPSCRGFGELGRSIMYEYIAAPCSPRAAESVLRAAQGRAFLYGRESVTAADIQAVCPDALAHRIRLTFEAQSKKVKNGFRFEEYIIEEVLRNVAIPRIDGRTA